MMKMLVIYNAPVLTPLLLQVNGFIGSSKKSASPGHLEFEAGDDLEPGDLVKVRSEEEIRSTLDHNCKFKGLTAMPEMAKFYGKEHRIFKKLNKIMVEATGELRSIKSPTYLLEGVLCDGEFHKGCDRSCFLLWKREWLKKV